MWMWMTLSVCGAAVNKFEAFLLAVAFWMRLEGMILCRVIGLQIFTWA